MGVRAADPLDGATPERAGNSVEIVNQFQVQVPFDQVWALFTDLERIAPMLPGASLDEVDGEVYRGTVKVKVGPIGVQYKGTARVVEMDEGTGRLKILADGRGARGQGDAHALFDATVKPVGGGTEVSVSTELTVTGRVAQFGRGVMSDVAEKLISQFAAELEQTLTAPSKAASEPAAAASDPAANGTAVPAAESPTATSPRGTNGGDDAIDLLGLARSTRAAKVLAPLLIAVAGGILRLWWVRRRRSGAAGSVE